MEIVPLKGVQRKRKLKIETFSYLIWGKSTVKETWSKPREHWIQKFIKALCEKACNGYRLVWILSTDCFKKSTLCEEKNDFELLKLVTGDIFEL